MLQTNQTQTNQPNNALTPRRQILAYGDWLAQTISVALARRLRHQNLDGTWYSPRVQTVIALLSNPPFYYAVLDDNALFHFPRALLINERTRDALSAVLHYPVFAFLPEQCDDLRDALRAQGAILPYGVTYAIPLAPLRVLVAGNGHDAAETKLPRTAPLDLATAPLDARQPNVPIGVSARGPWYVPLARMGHALITGATGSGKSTWIHTALATLFKQTTPTHLQVALIDPKRSELAMWANIPHRLGEIAHTPHDAERLLTVVVDEMDRRGDLIARALCRDIAGYNHAHADAPLPYLLVVIDECLDLVLAGKHTLTNLLKSIAIRGRSAGIILWAATQHASAVDGLPRVVALNLSSRLVFRVNDANAARSAGCPGAQDIPRTIPGRMLARISGEPIPVQSFYIGDDELLAAARALDGQVSVPASELSPRDRKLLAWAVEQGGGYLGIADIQQVAGVGSREARRIAERFERMGWLAKDPDRQNKRRVMDGVWAALADKLPDSPNLTN